MPEIIVHLPTAKDYMDAQFERDKKIYKLGKTVMDSLMKLAEEAEVHRMNYNNLSQGSNQSQYWKGHRDEAGYFRDRLLALIESL